MRRAAGLSWVLVAIGQGMLTAAALYVLEGVAPQIIRRAVSFSIDSLFYLTQAVGTVDNGWWWFNAMLGAPFGFDESALPANGNVDQIIGPDRQPVRSRCACGGEPVVGADGGHHGTRWRRGVSAIRSN